MNQTADSIDSDLELAQLITRIENRDPEIFDELGDLFDRQNRVPVLGITGPPGVGKSTLVDGLIGQYRNRDLSVAVVAVDPSSPDSGGAILGDRVRMQRHGDDPGVFIRSMSTRGKLGGLNSSIYDVVVALSQAEIDLIILETVGVGQGEVEVSRCADLSAVVLVPAYGDSVQMIKAGLQEVADCFVINKTDRYDPEQIITELRRMAPDPEDLKIYPVSAKSGEGLEELAGELYDVSTSNSKQSAHQNRVNRNHLYSLLREDLENTVHERLEDLPEEIKNPYEVQRELAT